MTVELSVLVPIYNEEDQLQPMATGLSLVLDEVVGQGRWQFVFAENGSSDRSPQIVQELVKRYPASIAVQLPRPNIGEALRAGLGRAEGEWCYIINVEFWDALFLRWAWLNREQYDLILGSKRIDSTLNSHSPFRRFLSWGLNLALHVLVGFVGRDTHGQKLLRLDSLRPIIDACVMSAGQFDTELTLRALRGGLWTAEAPVPILEQRKPRNSMAEKILRNHRDLLRLAWVMRSVPYTHNTRYHRWAREDMERLRVISWQSPDADRVGCDDA